MRAAEADVLTNGIQEQLGQADPRTAARYSRTQTPSSPCARTQRPEAELESMTDLSSAPTGDLIQIELRVPPVSVQAPQMARRSFQQQVAAAIAPSVFVLTGDIALAVEWFTSEQVRYETDRSPDVDNILKPLLDSLSGPDGLLIDDNQVQHVSCSWLDNDEQTDTLRVNLRFRPDEWALKAGLVFVQFDRGLCLPIPKDETKEVDVALAWLEAYKGLLAARQQADLQGLPYRWSRVLMPKQRVFHRTRLRGFQVLTEQEFRDRRPH